MKTVHYIRLWDKYLANFSPAMGSVSSASPSTPSTPTTPGGSKLSPGNIFKNFFKCVD
jgi:protein phosphatase 1 regulatory subunit 12A